MSAARELRKHEVSFCADVKSWADALFAQHPEWPFAEAQIEEYGRGSNRRQDLRILDRTHRTPILTGEAKMPGTPEGRTPYDPALMQDAFLKADNIQAPYFFTWNVNTFVLFDRSRWNVSMIERRVKEWDLDLRLGSPGDCARPDVQAHIRDTFLPRFFGEFARIVVGTLVDWGMAPDDIFLRSLESHLDWPVTGTRDYLARECLRDRAFAARLQAWMAGEMQWTFDPGDPENWRAALDRAARTLCYVFCNRAIFYKAIQSRYPHVLKPVAMPARGAEAPLLDAHFRRLFAAAVRATGDYEPVFYPDIEDWTGALVFADPQARQGWMGFFVSLDQYDFRKIPHDIVGGIFQKLISPEERQKFGQFFTHEDIVDVINAFCIRRAGDGVLDPACGSGSFLVRAYHRKAWLAGHAHRGRRHEDHAKHHQELLREIYGCDIALFPAHLATLNLAARQISDEESFPLIRRGNFFEVVDDPARFCTIPGAAGPRGRGDARPVALVDIDAVVGNPPYVRQELLERRSELERGKHEPKEAFASRAKNTKDFFRDLVGRLWPGLRLSGRSDLHCYFWPAAARFLREGGRFGFLTSSGWLDVEYGFALQKWMLQNFRILAVLESVDEPWFPDARIKTAVTVLERCSDPAAREAQPVRFVRIEEPLADLLGERARGDESARQEAAERLCRLIEGTTADYHGNGLRIICVPQGRLWQEGVEAGRLLAKSGPGAAEPDEHEGDEPPADEAAEPTANDHAVHDLKTGADGYAAGKWGRFLRAPDIYFRVLRDYGARFVRLGEIAEVRRGITSGCDAFFMPRDATAEELAKVAEGLPWNDVGLMTPCRVGEVRSGRVRIVRAGDGTLHPVEAEYLRPEVHSLMEVDRPVIRAADLGRVVLWVDQDLRDLAGTYVSKYIRWGARQTFASKKSRAVPVPQRSTCAGRPRWYDLTGGRRGAAFWPKSQQYRHIIPANPEGLICNCNLYDVLPDATLAASEQVVLPAILNCTFLALFKTYYGRYAGTEGNLKTEVVDVNLLDVPDVRAVSPAVARRIQAAFARMQQRPVTALVEEDFMDCHSVERVRVLAQRPIALSRELLQSDRRELDGAVLEMIGVADRKERAAILEELYRETARHYRRVRIVEVQKQIQRAGGQKRLTADEIAAGIWDSLADDEKGPPLAQWLTALKGAVEPVLIPDGRPKALGKGHLFSPGGVDFLQGTSVCHETYAHPAQAALVALLAGLEVRGRVEIPLAEVDCDRWRRAVEARLADARARFEALAQARTGPHPLRDAAADLLLHWFVRGRS